MGSILLIVKGTEADALTAAAKRGVEIKIASTVKGETRAYAQNTRAQGDAIAHWFAEPNPETSMIHGEGSGFPAGTLLFWNEVPSEYQIMAMRIDRESEV